jgi:transcriptional regulator with XRE-family HTH domain
MFGLTRHSSTEYNGPMANRSQSEESQGPESHLSSGELRRSIQAALRQQRKQLGQSLRTLSESTGIPISTIHSLETDPRSDLSLLRVTPIAKALGLSIDALVSVGRRKISGSLGAFCEARPDLTPEEISLLSSIVWPQGVEPRTVERWDYILNSIRVSSSLDTEIVETPLFLQTRPREIILEEPCWIDVESSLRTLHLRKFDIKELGQMMARGGEISVSREQLFHYSNRVTREENDMVFLFLVSILWSNGSQRTINGRLATGTNPFNNLEVLSEGLHHSFATLKQQGPIKALTSLLRLPGVGLLRAAPIIYIWSNGLQVEGLAPVPYRPQSQRVLVDFGKLPERSAVRMGAVKRYEVYLNAIKALADAEGVMPDVIEDALFHLNFGHVR